MEERQMEPCQGPAERIDALYSLKIYCLWRDNEVKGDIQQTVLSKLTAMKYMIQNKKSDAAPSASCHHMRVIEKDHDDDLRSGPSDDSFGLIICDDRSRDAGERSSEDICVRVNSDVFANRRSREGFFDHVNLLLSFLTDDASI
jgi:hypothetical protein